MTVWTALAEAGIVLVSVIIGAALVQPSKKED